MDHAYLDEIRSRAYKLWEEAGKPEGRIDEFWYVAEEQLNRKRMRHEVKTPDNL